MLSIRPGSIHCFTIAAATVLASVSSSLSEAAERPSKGANHHEFVVQKHKEVINQQALIKAGWRLVWQDDFNSHEINPKNWSHEKNCAGGGNNEQQCYTDRPENSFVDGGLLHIVAREEYPNGIQGPGLVDDDPGYPGALRTMPYSSARLRSKNKFDFTYGRVEIRARLAAGQGMWPALWMLPTDWAYGGWPSSGEIDIVEAVNLGVWGNEVHGTLHYGLPWPQWENHGKTLSMEVNPADDFHVYAIEWEADEIRWYVDGQHYQTQRSEGWYNYIWGGQDVGFQVANPRAPYDQRFHLIMNLAVGGDWPGAPDTGWPDDRQMLVDYVRVYQCHGPQIEPRRNQPGYTGAGCGTVDDSVEVHADAGAPGINAYPLYADGPGTVTFQVDDKQVDNALVPGQWELNPGNVWQNTGDVWDIVFNGLGNVFLGSADMSGEPGLDSGVQLVGGSGWTTNGELSFDIRVLDSAPDSQLLVKLDSGWPNLGQVTIDTPPADGEWYRVAIRISDLLANPLPGGAGIDLTNVANLFVLEHPGSYTHLQLDNIRLQCAFNTEPETWQLDKTCSLGPRIASNPLESPIGFEQPAELYNFADFAGGATAVVPNPDTDGNDSASVGLMQKYFTGNDWEHWGGSTLSLNRTVDVPEGSVFTMKVWSQRPVRVLFKLEGVGEIEAEHSGYGWEVLSFDFSGITGSTDALTLIFDLGTTGDAGGDPDNWTFYFDDIAI